MYWGASQKALCGLTDQANQRPRRDRQAAGAHRLSALLARCQSVQLYESFTILRGLVMTLFPAGTIASI